MFRIYASRSSDLAGMFARWEGFVIQESTVRRG